MPVVPPLVLFEIRKQPLMVVAALIEKVSAADSALLPASCMDFPKGSQHMTGHGQHCSELQQAPFS